MTRKYLRERQARNAELGKQEAAARCAHANCRKPLGRIAGLLVELSGGARFCSYDCLNAEMDYLKAREARR